MPETNFFWDPLSDNILQERDEAGGVTAGYTTEPGLYGNLISQNRQGVESQYHFDAIGSTLALTDDGQQVADTNAYTAFGVVLEQSGSTVNPFQYIGQKGYYHDDVAGECWRRPRVLSAKVERWLTSDTTAYTEGSNGYSYAWNNPTSLVDPSGNMAQATVAALFSFSPSTHNPRVPIHAAALSAAFRANALPVLPKEFFDFLRTLAHPPLPCAKLELSPAEHSIGFLDPQPTILVKCPGVSIMRVAIKGLIDGLIISVGPRETPCPKPCKCDILGRTNIPVAFPLLIPWTFCWKRGIPFVRSCREPGVSGPCRFVALLLVRMTVQVDYGVCT